MSGNNDLELNLSPIKKPTASRGRRANNSATKQGTLCLLCQEIPLKVVQNKLFVTNTSLIALPIRPKQQHFLSYLDLPKICD